ncbi:MAG: KdsC family phosphatase, partial [Pontibacterium sp.]
MRSDVFLGIKLVLFDVDGVLTNGDIYIDQSGEFYKQFNVKDGVSVALLKKHGIKTGVISGKHSDALVKRCEQLKLDIVVTGCHTKPAALDKILSEHGLTAENIVFVGDDVIDVAVMRRVAIAYAPADAHVLAKQVADVVTSSKGGEGVAREVAEHILQGRGLTLDEVYAPLIQEWDQTE